MTPEAVTRMTLPDQTDLHALREGYFSDHPDEAVVLAQLPRILKECRHFVDVGASLGQYTYHASRIMRNGRIDAIEADPARAQELARNCERWSALTGNTIVSSALAIAATSGEVTFYSTHSNVSGGLFPNALAHLDEETRSKVRWDAIRVSARTLDDLYALSPPDVIKMDIEGGEGEALLGAMHLLQRRMTVWLIELHGFKGGWAPGRVIAFMRSLRYRAIPLDAHRVLFMPVGLINFWMRTPADMLAMLLMRVRSILRSALG